MVLIGKVSTGRTILMAKRLYNDRVQQKPTKCQKNKAHSPPVQGYPRNRNKSYMQRGLQESQAQQNNILRVAKDTRVQSGA